MNYVYLDWNVIQYMKHATVQDSINGPEFLELVNKLSKKYKFPFSEGHLKDLAISLKPENKDHITADLDYLNALSQGYALGIIEDNESIIPTQQVDIYQFFEDIVSKIQLEPEINVTGGSYAIGTELLSKKSVFSPLLEENNGVLDSSVMSKMLQNLWISMDDHNFYKSFRLQVAELKNKFENVDTVIDQNSEYFKKIVPFLEFMTTEDLTNIVSDFEPVLTSFLSIDGRSIKGMTVGKKIEIGYMLLDYHPKLRDKVNKKNRPSNIARDCKNLFFASQANYYVTEDKATFKKSEFICKALSLKVKVVSMSDFTAKFS
ncbi:hypothetical protein [Photobacterium carnosum]|uniref:hypothetical protein n=1 Tax=Photobacterium carnosum TaxID=2023717 RepID=UPI001E4F3661|nr:hypothetical protein [Photobacterium carnosum]MCD9527570.1 hypothetical protein [Photobacterium carnosum]